MNSRSLSVRLVTWYAGVLTVVFVLLGTLTYISLQRYLEANLLDSQARRARQIADTLLAAAARTGEAMVAQEVEELYSPEANDRFIRITRGGHVVYASGSPKDGTFEPAEVPIPPARAGAFARREVLPHGSLLIATLPYAAGAPFPAGASPPVRMAPAPSVSTAVDPGASKLTRLPPRLSNLGGAVAPARAAPYLVEVGVSAAGTEATLRRLVIMLAVGLPAALCIAVAGGFVLVRRALQPVDEIARKAEQITQHNLTERLPVVQTGDELERLSQSLNHMISRLDEAMQTSKRFVADASHELRTPLTVLRGELENLAQDAQLKPQTRETLGSLLEEADRLGDIVEGLLALSRLDAGEANTEWVRFDLAELVSTTADQMSLLAADKNITVVREPAPGVFVQGDRARMKQVVVNLLDNAIKYTPQNGRVLLKITREGAEAVLEVADNGVGIPPEALPHVFKRFFRVDGSRSREQGGAGLGLSIVKSICTAHGAQVEVTSVLGQGSRFLVRQAVSDSQPFADGRPATDGQPFADSQLVGDGHGIEDGQAAVDGHAVADTTPALFK